MTNFLKKKVKELKKELKKGKKYILKEVLRGVVCTFISFNIASVVFYTFAYDFLNSFPSIGTYSVLTFTLLYSFVLTGKSYELIP